MPLIEIQWRQSTLDVAATCRTLNAAIAAAIGCRLDAVWSTWRTIDVDVRGDVAATGPIVHVYHHRTREQVEQIVAAIQAVLGRELSIEPDEVFVTTQPVSMPDPTLA